MVGYEVSGVVEQLGAGVNSELAGKSIVALTRFGGQSELIAVKATQMFEKPDSLTFEQGAAIPVNYLTAYALLVVMGSLHEGESVLIHNAGGGVGLAALDIAKKIGRGDFRYFQSFKTCILSQTWTRSCDWIIEAKIGCQFEGTHQRTRR